MGRGIKVRHFARMGYKQVSVLIRPDLYEKLIGTALGRRVTISDVVNEALDMYFKRLDTQAIKP